ncbi:Capsular associated protein [Apiospora marii]|uniref:Capsular associated protein n=1 Tax=Apiospora marii TaxID=335849 RepID=UPI00312FDB36
MWQQHSRPAVAAFTLLALSTAFITSRYQGSAAFERPFHFSVLVTILLGLAARLYSSFVAPKHVGRYEPLRPSDLRDSAGGGHRLLSVATLRNVFAALLRVLAASRDHTLLVTAIVARTAFLPCAMFALNAFDARKYASLPWNAAEAPKSVKERIASSAPWLVVALFWGISSTDLLRSTEQVTTVICPLGVWERLIPLAQMVMVGCDAIIIAHVGRLRQHLEKKNDTWAIVGRSSLISAGLLIFMGVWSCIDRGNLRWNVLLTTTAVSDLVVDSLAVVLAMVAAIYLMAAYQPLTVILTFLASMFMVRIETAVYDGTMGAFLPTLRGLGVTATVFMGAGALLQHASIPLSSSQTPSKSTMYRNKYIGVASVILLVVAVQTFVGISSQRHSNDISRVISNARAESDRWVAGAKKSTTLAEAVSEYKERHGIPPPPNFDKWYEYATSVDSPIIDDFGQIHADLLPFWGVRPASLRQRTTHLLERPNLSVGGLIIENGQVTIAPLIHGTHRWMMEVMQRMVEPFAEHLPDMQIAFNLDDECRVSVPFDKMEQLYTDGTASRARLATRPDPQGFSPSHEPPWPRHYLEDTEESQKLWQQNSPWFQVWSKSPIFYNWIASTCSPSALANNLHWWNRKATCQSCAAPHMTDGVVSNWTMSGDLCHQPDLAYQHGFLYAPSAFAATHELLPIFSQSRMHNFADILYPSPWNFGDKVVYDDSKSIPWQDKLNSLYWRGRASDGYATNGAWQVFLRARLVHLAASIRDSLQPSALLKYIASERRQNGDDVPPPVTVNVSFVGDFNDRCDQRDCRLQQATFYGSPTAEPAPSQDFEEHWHHRHLVDLDGAAFSGRFLPFLNSASLPYRAALFRTWWEERVHAWRHFVPLDVRLRELGGILGYLSGTASGNSDAERIASEGRAWAEKAMRKEDMSVYMFRLLLEWGRILDDRREEVGFAIATMPTTPTPLRA